MPTPTKKLLSEILGSTGYFDSEGNLHIEFVTREYMRDLAEQMAEDWPRDGKPTHQVRRFFQHCRAIEARLRAKAATPEQYQVAWAVEEASFRMLDAAAADALAKSPPKIPQLFHDFIKNNVVAVKNWKDFLKGFLPHFEALVGFGAEPFKKRERG